MSSAMFGGLLSGFAGVGLDREQRAHEEQMQSKRDQLSLLLSVNPMALDDQGRQTWAGMVDALGIGGKPKGGKNGAGGHFTNLMGMLGPLMGQRGSQQRPDGLANPVPGGSQQAAPQASQYNQGVPQGALPMVSNPADVLRGGQPAGLENPPPPAGQPNVPQGTMHPAAQQKGGVPWWAWAISPVGAAIASRQRGGEQSQAGPAQGGPSLGQLLASQNPDLIAQHQMDLDRQQAGQLEEYFKKKSPDGKLTAEQQDMVDAKAAGYPYTARTYRSGTNVSKKEGLPVQGAAMPPGMVDIEGQPIDANSQYQAYRAADGSLQYYKVLAKPGVSHESAAKQRFDEEVRERKLVTGEDDDTASKAMAKQHMQFDTSRALSMNLGNQIKKDVLSHWSDQLANHDYTEQNSRALLFSYGQQAKQAMQHLSQEAGKLYIGYMDKIRAYIDKNPSASMEDARKEVIPYYGMTEDEITDKMLHDAQYSDADIKQIRQKAFSGVGAQPADAAPTGGALKPPKPPKKSADPWSQFAVAPGG